MSYCRLRLTTQDILYTHGDTVVVLMIMVVVCGDYSGGDDRRVVMHHYSFTRGCYGYGG